MLESLSSGYTLSKQLAVLRCVAACHCFLIPSPSPQVSCLLCSLFLGRKGGGSHWILLGSILLTTRNRLSVQGLQQPAVQTPVHSAGACHPDSGSQLGSTAFHQTPSVVDQQGLHLLSQHSLIPLDPRTFASIPGCGGYILVCFSLAELK